LYCIQLSRLSTKTQNSHFHQIIHPISSNHTPIPIESVTVDIIAQRSQLGSNSDNKKSRSGPHHSYQHRRRISCATVKLLLPQVKQQYKSTISSTSSHLGHLLPSRLTPTKVPSLVTCLTESSSAASSPNQLVDTTSWLTALRTDSRRPLATRIGESSIWRREPARAASGDAEKSTHEHLRSLKWSVVRSLWWLHSIRGQRNKKTNGATHGFTAEICFLIGLLGCAQFLLNPFQVIGPTFWSFTFGSRAGALGYWATQSSC
jgi:hypothetical protein